MTNQHPITPPPELVKQWGDDILNVLSIVDVVLDCAWKDGYRAGARAARRPKPPSLAEQKQAILAEIDELLARMNNDGALAVAEPIRRALERLQELEGQGDG